ncbi:hypothetical protein HDU91_004927, partial [Kappamyces sp. JEL0680]
YSSAEDSFLCYYLVSLDILRLFPLSYLNQVFSQGIPIGCFLTGHEVKALVECTSLASPKIPAKVPSSEAFQHCNASAENLFEEVIESQYEDDASLSDLDSLDLDTSYKFLFERIDSIPPNILHTVAHIKGLAIATNLELFVKLGKYFQNVVFRELYDREERFGGLPMLSESEEDRSRQSIGLQKEFMFLKEHLDLYLVDRPSPKESHLSLRLPPQTKTAAGARTHTQLLEECTTALETLQAGTVDWCAGFSHSQFNSLKTTLSDLGYLSASSQWSFTGQVFGQKSLEAFRIIPLVPSNPYRNSLRLSHPGLKLDLDGPPPPPSPKFVTQVRREHNSKNVRLSIQERHPIKYTWWQPLSVVQTAEESPDETVGVLWLRRTWSLEYSIFS